jgi:membrane associated rhomboid family serine protease
MISGLVGSLFSSLFIQTSVTVGASGALAGLIERSLSNIVIEYWKSHLPKVVILAFFIKEFWFYMFWYPY